MRWEYKTYKWKSASGMHQLLANDLNKLGADGWEVIDSVPVEFKGNKNGVTEKVDEVVYLLKRQIN